MNTTVSGYLPSKDSEATFLLEAFIKSLFTHVTTRFLQVKGLGRYFYSVNDYDYQVVCRRDSIQWYSMGVGSLWVLGAWVSDGL